MASIAVTVLGPLYTFTQSVSFPAASTLAKNRARIATPTVDNGMCEPSFGFWNRAHRRGEATMTFRAGGCSSSRRLLTPVGRRFGQNSTTFDRGCLSKPRVLQGETNRRRSKVGSFVPRNVIPCARVKTLGEGEARILKGRSRLGEMVSRPLFGFGGRGFRPLVSDRRGPWRSAFSWARASTPTEATSV